MKQQQGFTLIELVAVLVILGILAAVAVPRFVNLQDEAQSAAVQAIAGNLASASTLNHAVDLAVEAGLSTDTFTTVADCTDAANLLEGGLPANYTIDAAAVADKAVVSCTLNSPNSGPTASFTVIGAAP